ncbi:CoA-transferase [Microvirga antarctica]|uniref:CoA-transferase n=1 Tax=Microvirga antarctica TaxID=2819233 RepID=UPI001B304394|nr:CoA-transferase [Microvirga antarctica]
MERDSNRVSRDDSVYDRRRLREMFAPPSRYATSKVMPLDVAIAKHVKAGMTIHFGYTGARPMAASNALVRAFAGTKPNFWVVCAGMVANQASLVSEGLIRKMTVSFVGENYPTASPHRIFQHAINSGSVEIENQSLLVIAQRLAAGASGFPFALTRSLMGSSMEDNPSFQQMDDPFGSGERIGLAEAIVPDVTIVHGLAADEQGNILVSPPFGEGDIVAFAAKAGVIATVERVVSTDVIRANPTLTLIPSHRVLSVSEAPMGSHPYAIYNPGGVDVAAYVEDYSFFREIRLASRTKEDFDRWVKEWILDVGSHEDYVRKLGGDRVQMLRGRSLTESWQDDLTPETIDSIVSREGHDAIDAMVVAATHVLEHKVKEEGFEIIEAGVGYANLAAWLAVSKLQIDDGIPVELVAEIGLYGFMPQPGEPFIFANRNLASAKSFTTAFGVLGQFVGSRHNNCLSIIGAAQIDAEGNINSTYAQDGRFLVGSGGANDINSASRDIIAITQQSAKRLVTKLPYITSPGRLVSTLVTDLGIFEKREGRFALTGIFPQNDLSQSQVVEKIRAECEWTFDVAATLDVEPMPTREELIRLRLFDPRNDFLNGRKK